MHEKNTLQSYSLCETREGLLSCNETFPPCSNFFSFQIVIPNFNGSIRNLNSFQCTNCADGILTFRRYFSFRTSDVVVRYKHPFSSKNHHFYDNNIGCSELAKYRYSERSSKNKRMFVKIFNGCSERQRHAHFC